MAGRGDVRAGRAFVELGTDDSKLVKGLQAGMRRVRSFAREAGEVGRRVALFGTATSVGMIAAARTFATAGAELARLRNQTGLSAKALSGLSHAAAGVDVPFDSLRTGLTAMQKAIANGGKDVEEALGRIGLSLEDVRALRPDEVLGLFADRLPEIKDEALRTATAMAMFGRGGADMLHVLAGGSVALNDAAEAAKRAGDAFDDDALNAAERLDDSFDELAASSKGLRNSLGGALAPAVGPLVDKFTQVVQSVTGFVNKNPELVRALLGDALALVVLGTTVAAVAAGISLFSSPVAIITVLLVGLTATALATSDALGVTATGFGDLFNSIRIGGQGLATWMAKFWAVQRIGWHLLVFSIQSEWDALTSGAKIAANGIYSAFLGSLRNLLGLFQLVFGDINLDPAIDAAVRGGQAIYNALAWIPKKILEAFYTMVSGIKSLLPGVGAVIERLFSALHRDEEPGKTHTGTVSKWIDALDKAQEDANASVGTGANDLAGRQLARIRQLREDLDIRKKFDALDQADPNDGTSGVRFDPDRAKAAAVKIGNNALEMFSSLLDRLDASIRERTNVAGQDGEQPGPFDHTEIRLPTFPELPALEEEKADGKESEKDRPTVDVLGTFNASVAGRIGFGTSLEQRWTNAAESTATNTRGILDELRANGFGAPGFNVSDLTRVFTARTAPRPTVPDMLARMERIAAGSAPKLNLFDQGAAFSAMLPRLIQSVSGRAPEPLAPGQLAPGNIDMATRPQVKNEDDSISTVRSITVEIDGKHINLPTVSDDGRIMADEEAVDQFRTTGRHLGVYADEGHALQAAQALHEREAVRIAAPALLPGEKEPGAIGLERAFAEILGGSKPAGPQAAERAQRLPKGPKLSEAPAQTDVSVETGAPRVNVGAPRVVVPPAPLPPAPSVSVAAPSPTIIPPQRAPALNVDAPRVVVPGVPLQLPPSVSVAGAAPTIIPGPGAQELRDVGGTSNVASTNVLLAAILDALRAQADPKIEPGVTRHPELPDLVREFAPRLTAGAQEAAQRFEVQNSYSPAPREPGGTSAAFEERWTRAAEATAVNIRAILEEMRHNGAAFQ